MVLFLLLGTNHVALFLAPLVCAKTSAARLQRATSKSRAPAETKGRDVSVFALLCGGVGGRSCHRCRKTATRKSRAHAIACPWGAFCERIVDTPTHRHASLVDRKGNSREGADAGITGQHVAIASRKARCLVSLKVNTIQFRTQLFDTAVLLTKIECEYG